jgi:uncharacterized protein YjbI with pentapeptide repeats
VHRCFDHRRKHFLVSSVVVAVPFDRPHAICTEPELWKMAQGELGRMGVLDFWMLKPTGEILATGACFTGGTPKQQSYVRVAVWPADASDSQKPTIDRRLMVFGDRRWGATGMTPPEPFTEMPVDYSRAFGGEKYDKNPIGRGLGPIKDEEGKEAHPLPNVEDPRELVASRGDRPNPGSPSSMDPTWPAAFKKVGTYDFDYAKKHAPGFADDIDFEMFNVAAPDQRLKGFWAGDERIRVENMHPTKPVLEARLPAFVARVFVRIAEKYAKSDAERDLVEVPLRLDTVHVFPKHERALMIYRGLREIATADATDVDTVLVGLEDRDADRRPLSHYKAALELRSDRQKLAAYALFDRDLMPDSMEPSGPGARTGDRLDAVLPIESLMQQNLERKRVREMQASREALLSAGADPALVPDVTPASPPPKEISLDEIPAIMEDAQKKADEARADAERRRADAEERLRAMCLETGQDYDAIVADAKKNAAGPPKFTAKGELQRMRELLQLSINAGMELDGVEERLNSPEFIARLEDTERQLVDAYRLSAHDHDPAPELDEEASKAAREELAVFVRGAPLERRDFTGADLRGVDLSGVDLSGAFFEKANLAGAKLIGATLEKAVFAHANLEGADLTGAKLKGASLGRANLRGALLACADLAETVLIGADLRGATLTDIALDSATWRDLDLDGAKLDGLRGSQLTFMQVRLNGVSLRGASLKLATFIDCDLDGADFGASELSETAFFMCRGRGAKFEEAKLPNLRIVHECDFEKAVFKSSEMPQTNLRGTRLAGADLSGCDLSQSDLSAADLTDADLTRANLKESLLFDTNLTRAKLRGANLMQVIAHRVVVRGADVSKANLFASDLSHAVGDDKTSFSGSNLKRAFAAGGFLG